MDFHGEIKPFLRVSKRVRHTMIHITHIIHLGSMDVSALDWEVESEMRRQEIPSISLSIFYGNQILFERAYGYADVIKETVVGLRSNGN